MNDIGLLGVVLLFSFLASDYDDDDDDDDEIAYFTVRWKTRELVLSTAPKTWNNTDKVSKNRKRSH